MKNILFYIIIGLVILGGLGWAFFMSHGFIEKEKCAEYYGGNVIQGYCTYVKDGTSKSYNIWERENLK